MTIHILQDVASEFRMPVDCWAVVAHCPLFPADRPGQYAVAWGRPADQLYSGIRPLGWSEDDDVCEHGIEWFDTELEAMEYVASVAETHASMEEEAS